MREDQLHVSGSTTFLHNGGKVLWFGHMARPRQLGFEPRAIDRFFEVSLLAMLASGYAALAGSGALDLASVLTGAATLAARALQLAGRLRWRPAPRLVTWATVGCFFFVPLDYLLLSRDRFDTVVHLVLLVAAIKLLSARTRRDYSLLAVIAFLEFLAASALSASLSFFVFLAVFLLAAVATFSSGEIRHASESRHVVTRGATAFSRRLGWLTFSAAFAILALTSALFFVLPRTARAALDRFLPAGARMSGFSNEVTLGQTGEIRRSSASAFHVRFEDNVRPAGLLWRGAALGEFNGWKWYNTYRPGRMLHPGSDGFVRLVDDDQLRRSDGSRMSYRVFVDAGGADALFVAGNPEHFRVPAQTVVETATGGYRLPLADTAGLRYDVYSFFPANGARSAGYQPLSESQRTFYLRLPPVDERVIALARRITAGARSDAERVRRLERYLLDGYRYSLEPLERVVDDPLAYFILERRKGHCEYFASALAVMARIVWVPARVVTGFRGGSLNPLSGWYVVRASEAHSWVEVWLPETGWTAVDATPPDPNPAGVSWLSRLGLWADAVDMFWQEWVLGYDIDRQLTLAFRVGESRQQLSFGWAEKPLAALRRAGTRLGDVRPGTAGWTTGLLVALLLAAWKGRSAAAAIGRLLRRRRLQRGEAAGLSGSEVYDQLLHALRRRGYERDPAHTPAEFASRLPEGPLSGLASEFTADYYLFRYGRREDAAPRLAALLDRIDQLP